MIKYLENVGKIGPDTNVSYHECKSFNSTLEQFLAGYKSVLTWNAM